jgi:hypothetical protein
MSKTKDPAALWRAIKEAEVEDDIDDVLAMSDAEVDAYIAANGGDPQKIRAAGEALAKELDSRHDRLKWHDTMEDTLHRVRMTAATQVRPRPPVSRAQLMARLERARSDPRFASPVAALFRGKTTEACTDQELETMLRQVELLGMIEDE